MLKLIVLIYGFWLLAVFVMQRSILFPRGMANARYAPPPANVEIWREQRPDGVRADAWFVPAPGVVTPAPAIVLLKGNAMLAGDWLDWAEAFGASGVHVLIPEYRGYGVSEGAPSRAALVGDATALITRLMSDPRVDAKNVVVYGRSIGGAIAAEALAETPSLPRALILHTVPARVADFSWRFLAPPFLVRDRFDAESAVAKLRGRLDITVIGHDRDEIVPYSHSDRLARAAGVERVGLEGTHNGFDSPDAEFRFARLIDRVIAASGTK
jgi:uncharacterized protein